MTETMGDEIFVLDCHLMGEDWLFHWLWHFHSTEQGIHAVRRNKIFAEGGNSNTHFFHHKMFHQRVLEVGLLRDPWTAMRSNQSILKEINPVGTGLISWKIWENGIETCKISCMKRVASPGSMHDTMNFKMLFKKLKRIRKGRKEGSRN